MNIRIIDFEVLTRHYNKYQEGVSKIEIEKESFMKDIKILESKFNQLIKKTDDDSELMLINQKIISKEKEFERKSRKISDDTNIVCYEEIANIIEKWAIDNNIDIVLSSNEVVYSRNKIDSTKEILDIFKINNLFVD
jgi:Skp family chaperone for outer membrane proteins